MPEGEPTREELEAIYNEQVKNVLAARLTSAVIAIATAFSCSDAITVLRSLADEIEAEMDNELQLIFSR